MPMSRTGLKLREELADGKNGTSRYSHVLSHLYRFIPGGRDVFIAHIERCARNGDSEARAWWRIFSDLLPVHQDRVNLDDICEASEISPDRIGAMVLGSMMRLNMDTAEMIASQAHPEIVHKTVKSAKRIGGQHAAIALKDRENLLTHQRFLPSRAGYGTSVTVNANSQAAAKAEAQASAQADPSVPTFAESLMAPMEAQREVQEAITIESAEE